MNSNCGNETDKHKRQIRLKEITLVSTSLITNDKINIFHHINTIEGLTSGVPVSNNLHACLSPATLVSIG